MFIMQCTPRGMGAFAEATEVILQKISFRPVNSIIFISGLDGGDAPYPVWGAQVLATPSCISIACYPEQDGPTTIALGDMQEADRGAPASFEATLETPGGSVIISTADQQTILRKPVNKDKVRIRIWLNHPKWADDIVVGIE